MPGYVHPDFVAVRDTLERVGLPVRGPGGLAVAVYHRGEKVVDFAAGTRDRLLQPFTPDTLCVAMSTSKAVVATLVHVLVDQGVLAYDAPVANYWPEFAQAGKGGITLRHVLAHASGLHAIDDVVKDATELLDWPRVIQAIEGTRARHAPGASFGYHAWTMGYVLGEVVQRATGMTLAQALDAHLTQPLGLDGCYIGLPEHERHRAAEVIMPAVINAGVPRQVFSSAFAAGDLVFRAAGLRTRPTEALASGWPRGLSQLDFNSSAFRGAAIPSVNGMYTAHSLARLFAPLSQGGVLEGKRLLREATLHEATRDQSAGVDLVVPFPLRFKLGYMRPVSLGLPFEVMGRRRDLGIASPAAFGHFGFGGSGAWADPERELSVGVVANSFFGRLPIDLRTVALCTAAAYCADQRGK
ncbi:MAG: beta-lactamase family protein [Sandaracinaceae bacterium]|nr:beta-lactamase family protein [Sandaracinaceae bacterium]MBK7155522.1 beta-lactamase family protein [Sandaracinaceae bacterium]